MEIICLKHILKEKKKISFDIFDLKLYLPKKMHFTHRSKLPAQNIWFSRLFLFILCSILLLIWVCVLYFVIFFWFVNYYVFFLWEPKKTQIHSAKKDFLHPPQEPASQTCWTSPQWGRILEWLVYCYCNVLFYSALLCTTLHCSALLSITLQCTLKFYTAVHSEVLHCTLAH